MPPRVTKRVGPGNKRAMRGRAAAGKVKVDDELEVKEEPRFEEENPLLVIEDKESEPQEEMYAGEKVAEDENSSAKNDDCGKEPGDYYERDERLDLDDNEPEYEPEEYGAVDYDDREIDQDPQEEGEDVDEEHGERGMEEEGDAVEEEGEDLDGELEPERNDQHNDVHEEHNEMVDPSEVEEHHEVVKERRKRKEFEVFVGGLDKDATENDLRKVFSEVGEVTEVRLMMNPQTQKNKGFAFLRFATVEQALRACAELKTPVINGKQCGVSPCQDSDTLFIGNICRTWTKEALKEKLKAYGVDNTEELTLAENSKNAGMNRGFAFLEFSSRSEAMDAFRRLQKRDVMFGLDTPAKVSFADSFIDPGDEIMAQVKTVFLDGLSASWNENHVKELLENYGKIEKVELARNMPSARRKDFGFVTFDTHDAAVTCARSINNEELGEGDNKAKVRARLSRPLQRGKGKYDTRRDVRPVHGTSHVIRSSWGRPIPRTIPRSIPLRGPRGIPPRPPPLINRGFKRPAMVREKRPVMAPPPRSRPVAAPLPRSYDRRLCVPAYPKSGLKRDYGHREELPPRSSRASKDYSTRIPSDRRPSFRDEYSPRGSGYPDVPRGGTSRSNTRRAYVDNGYSQRYERPPPTFREGRGHEYESISGSKRPYDTMDDEPPRYGESGSRHSRARLDYDIGSGPSRYGDSYSDRIGRSNLGYSGSRSSFSSQGPHEIYNSRQGMSYSGGSYGGADVGGMYSSRFNGDYMSRGDMSREDDVGGSSYTSLYSGRGLGGSSFMESGGSGSYY